MKRIAKNSIIFLVLIIICLLSAITIKSLAVDELKVDSTPIQENWQAGTIQREATVRETATSIKNHNDINFSEDNIKGYHIMKENEAESMPMLRAQANAIIDYLNYECHCQYNFNHIKHEGCGLDDGWANIKHRCSHSALWDQLFSLTDWWATGEDLNYYTKEELIANLRNWLNALDDEMTIKEVIDFLNDSNFELYSNPKQSTGYYLLTHNISVFCLKAGQAIGRYHGWLKIDHGPNQDDMSERLGWNYKFSKISWKEGRKPEGETFPGYLDKVIEEDSLESSKVGTSGLELLSRIEEEATPLDNLDENNQIWNVGNESDLVNEENSNLEIEGNPVESPLISGFSFGGSNLRYTPPTTEDGTIRYMISNVHYPEPVWTNLYEINNAWETYYTNVFAYATSFSEKSETKYHNGTNGYASEQSQLAIWGEVGDPTHKQITDGYTESEIDEDASAEGDDSIEYANPDINDIRDSKLWYAGQALDKYEERLTENLSGDFLTKHEKAVEGTDSLLLNQPTVSINANPDSDYLVGGSEGIGSKIDSTGTTIYQDNGEYYYKIGPFHMSDYALAKAKNGIDIASFSGANLTKDKSMLGGIVSGKVTFANESGGIVADLEIGTDVQIVYTDMNGTATNKGNYNWSNVYVETPGINEYKYPYPKSTFYITVKKDKVNNAVKLSDMSFEYRQTKSDGHGWVIKSAYVVTAFERKKEEHECSGKYECTTKDPNYSFATADEKDTGGLHNDVTYTWYCDDVPDSGTTVQKKSSCYCTGHDHDSTCLEGCEKTHNCGKYCNCSGHSATSKKGYYRCKEHGHSDCWTTHWKLLRGFPQIKSGQPFLAVHDSYTEVVKTRITTKLDIRLTTDIRVNKFITDIEHIEMDGIKPTEYDSTLTEADGQSREKLRDPQTLNEQAKKSNPVYVEYGDIVTYTIRLKNYQAQKVELKIKDVLPENCELQSVYMNGQKMTEGKFYELTKVGTVTKTKAQYTTNKFSTNWIEVPGGTEDSPGQIDIVVKVMVLAWEDEMIWENNVQIITNNEGYKTGDENNINYMRTIYDSERRPGPVVNLAELDKEKLTASSDFYKLNNYNLTIDKYIADYKSPISEFNQEQGFTNEERTELPKNNQNISIRYDFEEQEKFDKPFPAEKQDTLYYEIRLTNNAEDESSPNGISSGLKKATQVRPRELVDDLHEGLEFTQVTATLYDKNGKPKIQNIPVTYTKAGNNRYEFTIPNFVGEQYLIIDPGESLVYTVEVKVIESNMFRGKLDNEAFYKTLTNINDNTLNRIIQKEDGSVKENIAEQQESKEYVKMKDLVIAGKVWLDRDKDGYIGENANGELEVDENAIDVTTNPTTNITDTTGKEYAMKGIVVKLYQSDGTFVRETKTDDKGLFTFARDKNMNFYSGIYSYETTVIESDQRVPKANPKDNNLNYRDSNPLQGDASNYIDYYIEYEYDGLVYKSTEIYSNDKNINGDGTYKDIYEKDSNAYEFKDVREEFNTNYEIIAYNQAYKGDGTLPEHPALEYEKVNHESYIKVNGDRIITARSFITGKDKTKSIQNTKLLWLFKQQSTELPETEYLKFINLGLEEREDVDLSITHDVYELTTTINGERMTYEYNQNDYTLGNKKLDKAQLNDENTERFNSKKFMTGYDKHKSDTSETTNKEWYKFEYYLEDYNYRISQYNIQTVRDYKGSPLRTDYSAPINAGGNSTILDNTLGTDDKTNAYITGRESELNTEIKFRIKVTNNVIDDDEPHLPKIENGASADIPVYTGINEIVEYYSEDFVDIVAGSNGEIQAFNVKTKDENGYLVNTEMKIAEVKAYLADGTEVDVRLSNTSPYNTTRTIEGFDTIFITPINQNVATNALTGTNIKAGQLMLAEGESLDIIIKFVVEKEAETPGNIEMETILGDKENVAEISAYSTYYKEGDTYKSASLVDKDSNPGNYGETYGETAVTSDGYIKYYEDDTFKTGIKLKLPDPDPNPNPDPGPDPDPDPNPPSMDINKKFTERTLVGYVWDDARSETAKNNDGTQYIGNGIWNEKESEYTDQQKNNIKAARKNPAVSNGEKKDIKVQDVEAKLVEQIRIPVYDSAGKQTEERIYEDTIYVNGSDSIMAARTDSDGKYMLSGYVPGEYIVRFTYGDDLNKDQCLIFNGQDYKSTSYQAGVDTFAENAEPEGDKTARDVRLDILEHANISDAKDDEIRRLEVIGYSETMDNQKNEILRGKNTTNNEALVDNTSMFAETIDFLVRAEKEIEKVTVLTYQEYINKVKTDVTETITQARFRINNIDFGIEYRPESQLSINKYISNITVTTSDQNDGATNTPLVAAIFDEFYGVVKYTDYQTGATTFCTDNEGEIIRVNPTASTGDITSTLNSKGINTADVKKNNDGTYIIAIAGTELNRDKSIGLSNVQYLPNEYETDSEGRPVTVEANGKILVSSTQGFAYIVVDDKIMQGATIKIKYLFSGTNLGEIDRVSSNLSDLRFKENNEVRKYDGISSYYGESDYQISELDNKPPLFNQNYSAAKTARNALFSEYYRYELANDDVLYKVKPKYIKVDNNSRVVDIAGITNAHTDTTSATPLDSALKGNTYYGRYLGSTYFTGTINQDMDVIAELKIDKILDYIDNDLVFDNDDNRGKDNLWKTTTVKELSDANTLNEQTYSYYDQTGKLITDSRQIQENKDSLEKKLVDSDGRAYDTKERSNLAISLDDRVRDDYGQDGAPRVEQDTTTNKKFSKFLIPRYSKGITFDDIENNIYGVSNFGTISLYTSKVISSEDKNDDMIYENVAEVIQYSSVTGRVTNLATTIGNAKIEELRNSIPSPKPGESSEYYQGRRESDTASVERVTLTPPTGLSRLNRTVRKVVEGASYTVAIIIAVIIVCVVVLVIIKIYRNRRIK